MSAVDERGERTVSEEDASFVAAVWLARVAHAADQAPGQAALLRAAESGLAGPGDVGAVVAVDPEHLSTEVDGELDRDKRGSLFDLDYVLAC